MTHFLCLDCGVYGWQDYSFHIHVNADITSWLAPAVALILSLDFPELVVKRVVCIYFVHMVILSDN